jgi:FkbH-like protein
VGAVRGRATKCLVLDLDNTLWGGVLGEEGSGGIVIGPERPGREFLDFQRQLLELQRQGILLAVCSKNNEHEVLEVFRDHPDQLIREEHLVAHRINWQDKATNLRELAAELNIGLEHMMFLDDSPHEREWVRSQIPEIEVPELPADPTSYADWLGSLSSLVVLDQTDEDGARTQQYQEQRARTRVEGTASSHDDFLRQLDLRVEIAPMDEATLPRVVQLLAKTNQFNLTTRRHDAITLRRNVEAGAWRVYTMRVTDRFGDFGLTGVAVVAPAESWHIDSFLLSCRVIGKSVETALLAAIAADAWESGARRLTAEFVPTERNAPARHFLKSHGFRPLPDGGFERDLDEPGMNAPFWITYQPDRHRAAVAAART